MPELPEVETIRRDLTKRILHKPITAVKILSAGTVKNPRATFIKTLQNNSFQKLDRIGKLMIFELADIKTGASSKVSASHFLLIHLKMTGQLIYVHHNQVIAGGHSLAKESDGHNLSQKSLAQYIGGELPNKMTRVFFIFADGSRLFFNDQRRFGYLKIVDAAEVARIKNEYGIEPLAKKFSAAVLTKIIQGRQKSIKAILLDQKLLAGVGNIYADEVLFLAGLRPERRANTLTKTEIARLAKNLPSLLKKAITERGTTFNNYVDAHGRQGNFVNFLKVYGRAGQPCKRCGGLIQKTKVAGRGTNFCSHCQK